MSADPGAKLAALLAGLAPGEEACARPELEIRPGEPMTDPVCQELVWAYLVWEAGPKLARAAMAKLCESFVDLNELRVCLPSELAAFFGTSYPLAMERGDRLRATLNDIFSREHAVTLASLPAMNKRDARAYLDSLEGIPPYVAARTMLVGLGGHAFPLDERLMAVLLREEALGEAGDIVSASGWLERQVRSGEAARALFALEAHADSAKPTRAATGAKKSAKPGGTGGRKKSSRAKTRKGDTG